MDIKEFNTVKTMSYRRYCRYLQDKYGIGLDDYFTSGFSPKKTCKRTNEGLFVHHIKEDTSVHLSDVKYACVHEALRGLSRPLRPYGKG